MVEARKHTYILEEYLGIGGPDQWVLDMKGVKVTDITDEEKLWVYTQSGKMEMTY